MAIHSDIAPFRGWARNLRLANEKLELIVTLDIGPRIISCAPVSGGVAGDSVFHVFPDQAGGANESEWQNRGGHRLWVAPEGMFDYPFSYTLDNGPVHYEQFGAGSFRFRPSREETGIQKEFDLELHPDAAEVTVTHRLINAGSHTLAPIAPWALSVMAAGGSAIVPQPALGEHPRDLRPNRGIVLWPFSDTADPRLRVGTRFLTFSQDAARGPFKFGLTHALPWAAYSLGSSLFVKRWAYDENAAYPDFGCTAEFFSNADMLEVESLGPLVTLAPGEVATHVEHWSLFTGLPAFDARDDDAIAAALPPGLERS